MLCQASYSIFNDEHNFVPIFNELLCSAEVPKLGDYSVMCDKGVGIRCNGAEGGGADGYKYITNNVSVFPLSSPQRSLGK